MEIRIQGLGLSFIDILEWVLKSCFFLSQPSYYLLRNQVFATNSQKYSRLQTRRPHNQVMSPKDVILDVFRSKLIQF